MASVRWVNLATSTKASTMGAAIQCTKQWQPDKFAVSSHLASTETTIFSVRVHVDGSVWFSQNWKARIGIKSVFSGRTFFLKLQGSERSCCDAGSCIPEEDCPSAGDTAELQWDPVHRKLGLRVGRGSTYPLHTVSPLDKGPFQIVAELEGSTALSLSRLAVETSSQAFRREAEAKGATMVTGENDCADSGREGTFRCEAGGVRCGDRSHGLCKFCGPPRYCM